MKNLLERVSDIVEKGAQAPVYRGMVKMRDNQTHFNGSFDGLRDHGINFLTGESCAYFMRGLCDLSQAGVDTLSGFFGSTIQFNEKSNWNSKVGDDDAIASIMLTHAIIPDVQKYILFAVMKYRYVATYGYEMVGFSDEDTLRQYQELSAKAPSMGIQIFNNLAQPSAGGRNVHAFSGRSS